MVIFDESSEGNTSDSNEEQQLCHLQQQQKCLENKFKKHLNDQMGTRLCVQQEIIHFQKFISTHKELRREEAELRRKLEKKDASAIESSFADDDVLVMMITALVIRGMDDSVAEQLVLEAACSQPPCFEEVKHTSDLGKLDIGIGFEYLLRTSTWCSKQGRGSPIRTLSGYCSKLRSSRGLAGH